MNYIKLFEEFNYEKHQNQNIHIISRVVLTFNNGKSNDYIIEVEGILGQDKAAELQGNNNTVLDFFKPTEYPKVFSTPDFYNLEKGEDITDRFERHTDDKSIIMLRKAKDEETWIGLDFSPKLEFNKVLRPLDLSRLGSLDCILSNLSIKKI